MKQGGKRKGAGRPNKNQTGEPITFNCWPLNLDKVKDLRSRSQLTKVINNYLKRCKL